MLTSPEMSGDCQNSGLDILQNNGWGAGRRFLGGSGCFCFSCPARTVMFQLLGHSKEYSKQNFQEKGISAALL